VGAKVNGRMMPLRTTINSGDTVEILTSKDQHPRRDWLEFVKTGRAMARIRRYLRNEERETGARLGREMLENELKKFGSSINGVVKSGALKRLLKTNNIREPDELFINLAQGHTALRGVVKELLPDQKIDETPDVERTLVGRVLDKLRGTEPTPVLIGGEEDVLVTRANCCNPLPGDPVAGYITRGRGISIHRRSCPQLLALEPERRVPVEWNAKAKGSAVAAAVRVICADRPGLLANITQACSDAGINITGVSSRRLNDEKAEISLEVGVGSVVELQNLIRRLERIRGVITVDRSGAQS
jgi:GTP pyrophosphokinase